MNMLKIKRIESIDLLKGLVMVVMALDHTRDYFHFSAFLYDPTDPVHTTWPIFLTRWITHYCAPTFSFLAGMSAFLISRRKSTPELSHFLFTRGLWLVFIELTIVNFAWFFDIQFRTPSLITIWSLGVSMIVLSVMIYLPKRIILIISCLVIFGHDLLDNIHFKDNMPWAMIHDGGLFNLSHGYQMLVGYPVIPWIAVMSLGYCFGSFYDKSYSSVRRRKILTYIGITAIITFIIVRSINIYGDPIGWKSYDAISKSMMSFLNPQKYPPSLLYLLMTLGPSLIFLANSEQLKGRIVNFFCTFGRVPFFFYVLHIYVIHVLALVAAQLTGYGWNKMIFHGGWLTDLPGLKGYGFPLWIVYLVWIGIIAICYPLCKKFDAYKMNNKEKRWLSYL
ncbi:heparan-alpha-glucosaminide N-acetyltransferase domain-containing protein [Ferruginibacter lapsinanis]|uniref:DUF1624 domain-containing protein n=1 Tax=Ferruginibacter lapsinanis TaxID=563172 RepID=UPI001E42B30D|nr:heparan-alpha-glucosaminide N-acetyltransferase domain-containing protein [Ferruginibacter lapsinanis]UEG48539.1 heparan-alpha-glucosaminide N-acetyltransferase domain-containing protein [Ferruginibacter lapsinanis]